MEDCSAGQKFQSHIESWSRDFQYFHVVNIFRPEGIIAQPCMGGCGGLIGHTAAPPPNSGRGLGNSKNTPSLKPRLLHLFQPLIGRPACNLMSENRGSTKNSDSSTLAVFLICVSDQQRLDPRQTSRRVTRHLVWRAANSLKSASGRIPFRPKHCALYHLPYRHFGHCVVRSKVDATLSCLDAQVADFCENSTPR